jgi:hypothetical protein
MWSLRPLWRWLDVMRPPHRRAARRITPAAAWNALPEALLAAVYLVTWIAPGTFGSQMVRWLFLVLLMELIAIQSAGLMGTVAIASVARAARIAGIVGFAAFYTVFAGSVSIAMASWWPVVGFWGQTLNRLLGVILGQVPDEETRDFVVRGWAASIVYYLGGLFLALLLPVPSLGLTPRYIVTHAIQGSEVWFGQPQKLMAAGLFYYGLTAWSELTDHRWAGRLPALRRRSTLASTRPGT